ncbi:hypothetical protein JTE90_017864 [Oedothorax gibbosus]|uniref:Uncharacterized protein n=1 Tax=Oedothorax gibbosus TaxID=931172 RepID=A0AAV6V402_9ARAC|nr:hypothetical protein JTE90_017864 [Oedothorax gibbosus]
MGGLTDISQTKYPIFSEFSIIVLTLLFNVCLYTTVVISVIICCEVQISSFRVFYSLNHSFKNILESNGLSKNDLSKITTVFQRSSKIVRTANGCYSPIAFVLIGYYAFGMSYIVSKLVDQYKDSTIEYIYSVGWIIQCFTHFVLLVLTSSCVDAEMLKSQNMMLMANSDAAAHVLLSTSRLVSCRNESILKPLGAFKLEKSFILVFLGAIVSYEVMILPFLR